MTETLPSHGKDESSRARCAVGLLTVLCVYSLPFAMQLFRREPHLHIAVEDEKIYLARVVDAYRGGSLGNPYLAEHQDAERFMPELAERSLALRGPQDSNPWRSWAPRGYSF